MADAFDLIVLGGGPAGAVSAWLAARDGLRVALIDPCCTAARLEGLSPRLHHWLGKQGLLKGFDGIFGPLRRRVDWAGISDTNSEYVVERDKLDAHLRAAARRAGAQLRHGSGTPVDGGAILSSGHHLQAPMVIDARGRKSGHHSSIRAAATLAICGWMAGAEIDAGISITAISTGWVWRVALPDGRIWVQAIMDATGHGSPAMRLHDALSRAEPSLTSARPVGQVNVRAAQPRLPAPLRDLTVLPVGDALAAMDPLSGHGQFWAVSSALAVAAVRRSLAACPGQDTNAMSLQFLNTRAVGTSLHQARVGRDFLRLEQRFSKHPFWQRRTGFPDNETSIAAPEEITVGQSIVVENGQLARRDILLTPRSPDGVAWFGPVPAVEAWQIHQTDGLRGLQQRWGQWDQHIQKALLLEETPAFSS
ncbi:pilus assembly protein CpaD [Paracoccus sp. Z330]|uniref:Pilus assembly protein CpaD n=1 Tax=Paracoccus onchidii TaxID=3017813 RepID=A0ABT4ZC92_9RHOB|nr:pilus assembly protein CpaD [Paracoccus onchidii]MDB6176265.1 pilus assembly protein CpaD [Paracoccus onchidii]